MTKKLFLIVGEKSGDIIGASIIKKLKKDLDLEIYAIAGSDLEKENINKIFDISEFSFVGIFEILPHLFSILQKINYIVNKIIEIKPDFIITIDAPDLSFRIISKFKEKDFNLFNKIKKIHIVAPSVWVYRKKRAKKIAKLYDLLLCFLPFEPKYFLKYNLDSKFIGHPIINNIKKHKIKANNYIRNKYKIKNHTELIAVTAGSRKSEIKYHIQVIINSILLINKNLPEKKICYAFIILNKNKSILSNFLDKYNNLFDYRIIDEEDKYELFNESKFAIAKSGTNNLEILSMNKMIVTIYRAHIVTYLLFKLLTNIKYVNIVNILANQELIKELIQFKCNKKNISNEVIKLFNNEKYHHNKLTMINDIIYKLLPNNDISSNAAKYILNIVK